MADDDRPANRANKASRENWVPLYAKLVWPAFIGLALVLFNQDVGKILEATTNRIEEGGSIKTPWFELGEAAANTEIATLSGGNLPSRP